MWFFSQKLVVERGFSDGKFFIKVFVLTDKKSVKNGTKKIINY